MYDFIGLIKEFFGLGRAAIDLQSKRLDLKNTAAMEQAKERQDEVKAQDTTNKAIADRNIEEVRKETAE